MRHSTPTTVTGRLAHWAVAAVAAAVAIVWVAVTIVPSLAESRVPDNFPVQVPLEAKLVGAKDPSIAGKPGYNDIRDLGYAEWGPNGKKVIKQVLKDGKAITGPSAVSVEYANGGIGFCVEPEEGGVSRPDDLGKGSFSVTFASPELMPSKTRPFSMSEGDMKNIQAFTKIFNSNPDAAEPGVWMGALYSVIGGYSVTMMDQQKDTYVSNVVADVKKLAPSLETNEEKINSLKLAVGDANGGKVVKIIGSEQAIEALKAAPDSTVKITGEGITPTEGSIKQAIGDGIPVKMTCQAGQTAKLHAEWTGPIQLTGMFAAAPYTRDQVKTVVTPQNITIASSVDAEVPCSPTPEKPTTPAEPTPEVKAPEIATSAADQSDGDKVLVAGQDGQIVDTVTLKNLVEGAQYSLTGTLMDKATGKPVAGAKAEPVEFTAKAADETQKVTFSLPAEAAKAGASYVVFEKLTQVKAPEGADEGVSKNDGSVVATHEDIEDQDQTVIITEPTTPEKPTTPAEPTPEVKAPEIATSAADQSDGDKTLEAGKDGRVVDTVTLKNLVVGATYKLEGTLMDKATGEPVAGAKAEPVEFVAEAADGTQKVVFEVPGGVVKPGVSFVAFEKLTQVKAPEGADEGVSKNDGSVVARHEDIDDEAQTVTVDKPEKPTTPTDDRGKTGGFTVAKKVVADGIDAPETFSFRYACGETKPADDAAWKTLADVTPDKPGTVEKIPAGQTCWITEVPATVKGAELTTSWMLNGAPVTGDTVEVTIGEDTTASLEATNTYRAAEGKLTIGKKVDNPANLKQLDGKSYSFAYVCATGENADALTGQGKVDVAAGETATVEGIPAGSTCAVTEANADVAGATLTTSWAVDGQPREAADMTWGGKQLQAAVQSAPVTAGTEVAVTATNLYQPAKVASFALTKKLAAPDPAAFSGRTFDFTYECTPTEADPLTGEFSLAAGETFSSTSVEALAELKPGTSCTITEKESEAPEGLLARGVTYDRATGEAEFSSDSAHASVTFTIGEEPEPLAFTATNSYQPKNPAPENPNEPGVPPTEEDTTPTIGTTLTGGGAKTVDLNAVGADEPVTFVDTVTFTNLRAGETYYVEGTLVDAAGTPLKGMRAISNPLKPQGKEGALVDGTAEMTFTLPASMLVGHDKVVAFEKLWTANQLETQPNDGDNELTPKPGEKPVASHEDLDDASQIVTITQPTPTETPKTKISFVKEVAGEGVEAPEAFSFELACGEGDNAVSENLELKADEPVTKELAANLTCHLSEKAADVAGYTHSLAFAGTGVTVTADKATATFTVPATAQGEEVRIVATNTYTPVDVPTPKVATTARAVSGEADNGKTLKPGEDATIEDTLAWENLPAGDYVLVPTLQTKGDHGITATPGQKAEPVTFTVEEGQKQGEVKATIAVPSTQVAPHTTFVVFEKVYRAEDTTDGVPGEGTTPVATHENPDDEGQTVTVDKPTPVTPTDCGDITPDTPDEDKPEECRPEVSTTAADSDGDKIVEPDVDATIVDRVTWKNLAPGTYTVLGQLMDKKTGTAVEGAKQVEPKTIKVGAFGQSGTVDIAFTVPAKTLTADASYVVFERLYRSEDVDDSGVVTEGKTPVAEHTDITDDDQTVTTSTPDEPTAPTPDEPTAPTPDKPTAPTPDKPTAPTPDKPTAPTPDKPTAPTPDKPTAPTPDKPTAPTPDKPTAPTPDKPTTPAGPKVTTTATHAENGDKALPASVDGKVHDELIWENFEPGHYEVIGELMDKATHKPVPGAKQIERVRFEVREGETTGKAHIHFAVPASEMKPGASYVVFEHVYRAEDVKEGKPVAGASIYADDADITNANQTVVVVPANAISIEKETPMPTPEKPGKVTGSTQVVTPAPAPQTTWNSVTQRLARTGASTLLIAGIACAVTAAGWMLVRRGRRRS